MSAQQQDPKSLRDKGEFKFSHTVEAKKADDNGKERADKLRINFARARRMADDDGHDARISERRTASDRGLGEEQSGFGMAPSPEQRQKREIRPAAAAKQRGEDEQRMPGEITPADIDNVIKCVEREYGAKISDEVKQTMRREISAAVPELTNVLKPLIMDAAESGQYKSEEVQQQWIRSFMDVMLPHMQKIVEAAQLQQRQQQ